MGVVRTVIVEDEKPAARLLQRKLEKLGITPEAMLHSVAEAVAWFEKNSHPDLIFLDIQLSDGLSFEIFERVAVESAIIFTTAYDEYALKAFKLNSIDYLLKPIDEDELESAVQKFRSRNPSSGPNLDELRRLLSPSSESYRKRFTVRIGQQLKIVPVEDIECIYSENKGTYLHTADNRDYLIDQPLEALEPELDPAKFFRVSRKFIVSLAAIKEIQIYSNSRLKVILPTFRADEVIVARERVAEFKAWLG